MTEKTDKRIRERLARNMTGILIAIVFLSLWYIQGWALRIALTAMLVLSVHEMFGALAARGAKPFRAPGYLFAALAMPLNYLMGARALPPLFLLMAIIGLTAIVLRGAIDFDAVVATLIPLIYPGAMFAVLFPISELSPAWLATVLIGLSFLIALMGDLMAFEIGVRLGKHKLCPALSPKKTVEGSIAGLFGSLITALIIPSVAVMITPGIMLPPLWHFALLGVVGGAAGQVGDLTASLIKRHCGIKDFGTIFPGHGGMLDRIDSVVFTAAVLYCYVALVLGL